MKTHNAALSYNQCILGEQQYSLYPNLRSLAEETNTWEAYEVWDLSCISLGSTCFNSKMADKVTLV